MLNSLINKIKNKIQQKKIKRKDNHPNRNQIIKRSIGKKMAEELIKDRTNQLIKLRKETNLQKAKERAILELKEIYKME